ncbi:MAG: response regulator [Elusimicrobiota bacterium]
MIEKKERKILVVDDMKEDRLLCKLILEKNGYGIREAVDGQDALKILDKERFYIVIVDIKMPGINGLELTRIIKEKYEESDVIIISTVKDKGTALEAMQNGALEYITKPFDKKELMIAVNKTRLHKALKLESEHLDGIIALHKASKEMVSTKTPDEILDSILDIAVQTVKADGGSILLIDEEKDAYIVRAAVGTFKNNVIGKSSKPGYRICGRAIERKEPILVDKKVQEQDWFIEMKKYEKIYSGMSVPIIFKDKVIGVINVKRTEREDEFTEQEMEIVDVLAADAAVTLENAQLYNRIKGGI